MSETRSKVNLKSLTYEALVDFFARYRLPAYRVRQLNHWMYERLATDIDDITEFSKPLRQELGAVAYISNPEVVRTLTASDGTTKYLLQLQDGQRIEAVLIPDAERLTLCISSQVGCRMGCRFCLTATLGFKRNLLAHEIVDQVITVARHIALSRSRTPPAPDRVFTNIVLMGMGEPLDNLDEVVSALWRLTNDMGFSKRHITLSTCGVVPGMLKLHNHAPAVNLAVSLNATTNQTRSAIMPVNNRYNLQELLRTCRAIPLTHRQRITFEYVLLEGVNDGEDDAMRLCTLLKGIPAKVNLIPFNEYKGAPFKRPSDANVLRFQRTLSDRNMTVFIRKSKGADIMAACGQLRAAC
ncbi:ribosomal RNA large subunit methyltransferase N [Candidatus Magnetobacterium bavaricum]|uniref:Probable dual-specificity RNA methyltransferase RlmN n=1 Tax=Candidatus Magnetobacterium bavaricum TaxID=29290 RepID=A0A0F3GLG0_9BACT|nr:ribosomal RNA large subunit methyltransferase N [Candidatus Magnetobacterium bavaricum]